MSLSKRIIYEDKEHYGEEGILLVKNVKKSIKELKEKLSPGWAHVERRNKIIDDIFGEKLSQLTERKSE